MIEAFQIDYTPEILQGLQLSLLMAVFLHIILIIIGSLLKHLLKLDPIEHATSIYSNSGNLIIPIVMSLFWQRMGHFTPAVLLWCKPFCFGRIVG